jgi:iron complex outermembrane recepter protein
MKRQFQRTALSAAAAQVALLWSGIALAQTPAAPEPAASAASAPASGKKADQALQPVIVTGQRAALQSAQKIKQDAEEIVDSVVADDIGKLPDKSVTEVLQRIPGITIDRTLNRSDPQQGVGDGIQHFAAEGTGVSIRGLSYVRSEVNGRDSFSANGGRALSFEDVPPELMSGVDVYKNPSAEQIEGAIGGLVNLRTALPFDFKGAKGAFSVETSRQQLRGKAQPSFSGLLSNRWATDLGEFGALVDLAHSKISTRSNGLFIDPYYPRTNAVVGDTSGQLRWISRGGSWNESDFDRTRDGVYGALQWRKDDVSSSLTYFRSKYEMNTTQHSFFVSGDPNKLELDPDATFDANGALLTGTLRAPTDVAPDNPAVSGLGFGTVARNAGRTADTRDISWNVTWKASPQWTFRSDLQEIKALSDGFDYLVGTGGWMPKQRVDLSSSPPKFHFDAADRAFLADPSNYYWGSAQEHRDHATATQKAWRGDAKFTFDHPVLNDVRFGVRLTERKAVTDSTHDSEWAQITAPWAVGNSWQPLAQLAWMSDPRFAGNNNVHPFNNFFNGQVPMPAAVVVPNTSLLNLAGLAQLHDYTRLACKDPCPSWVLWNPARYGDAQGRNEQNERTKAAYGQLRFGFEDWAYPVDGNVGLRVVQTDSTAVGNTLFTPPSSVPPGVPVIPAQSELQSFKNSYTNTLPSLNLRLKANKELQFRFAASKGMSRPELWQMQPYTTLSQTVRTHQETDAQGNQVTVVDSIDYSGSARGNPMLKPTTSTNVDLTAEYYFGRSSSFTVALFHKQLKDVVIGQTTFYRLHDTDGLPHDFSITSPVNGAEGKASGLEFGYQQYFDKLPGWLSGFGLAGNYTYIDSRMDMYRSIDREWCTPKGEVDAEVARRLYGCDTNGHIIGSLPLVGMSRHAFNLALLYDRGPISARVAYSWRSKYLQAAHAFGTNDDFSSGIDYNPASPNYLQPYSTNYSLPTWGASYGQLDMGVHYKVTDNLTVAFEGQNLTDALYKQYMQQGIGLKERSAFYTGRRYTLQMRYSF